MAGASAAPWSGVCARGDLAIVLVRHGRTAWNHERRFLGRTDLSLDETGRAEVAGLASHIPRGTFDTLYCSPLARARQTADALAPPIPVVHEAFRELDLGVIEGMDHAAAREGYATFFQDFDRDPTEVIPPGAPESLATCRDRVLDALRAISDAHGPRGIVGIVSHQLAIAGATCTIAGAPLSRWRDFGLPNGTISVLSWDGSAFAIEALRWHPDPPGPTHDRV
jgi:broad specificity phosphatase PhoE